MSVCSDERLFHLLWCNTRTTTSCPLVTNKFPSVCVLVLIMRARKTQKLSNTERDSSHSPAFCIFCVQTPSPVTLCVSKPTCWAQCELMKNAIRWAAAMRRPKPFSRTSKGAWQKTHQTVHNYFFCFDAYKQTFITANLQVVSCIVAGKCIFQWCDPILLANYLQKVISDLRFRFRVVKLARNDTWHAYDQVISRMTFFRVNSGRIRILPS